MRPQRGSAPQVNVWSYGRVGGNGRAWYPQTFPVLSGGEGLGYHDGHNPPAGVGLLRIELRTSASSVLDKGLLDQPRPGLT